MHSTVCVIVVNKISDGEKQHFFNIYEPESKACLAFLHFTVTLQ